MEKHFGSLSRRLGLGIFTLRFHELWHTPSSGKMYKPVSPGYTLRFSVTRRCWEFLHSAKVKRQRYLSLAY